MEYQSYTKTLSANLSWKIETRYLHHGVLVFVYLIDSNILFHFPPSHTQDGHDATFPLSTVGGFLLIFIFCICAICDIPGLLKASLTSRPHNVGWKSKKSLIKSDSVIINKEINVKVFWKLFILKTTKTTTCLYNLGQGLRWVNNLEYFCLVKVPHGFNLRCAPV